MNTTFNFASEAPVADEIYLYCLAYPECIPLIAGLPERGIYGIDEMHPVLFLEQNGIVAVIGPATASEFTEKNLGDLDWIGVRGLRHEQVVEAIMENSPVVPVRFGTLFHSRATLSLFLNQNSKIVSRILNALQGKAEWSIKGYLNTDVASRKIAAENVDIQSGLATLSSSPGARYLQQKKLDGMVKSRMNSWIDRLTHDIDTTLATSSLGMAELRLPAPSAPVPGERLIFHRSFLVSNQSLADFRAIVGEQVETHGEDGLRLELRGPWPPHNFCPDLVDGDLAKPEVSSCSTI
jgi:hypothetical protein